MKSWFEYFLEHLQVVLAIAAIGLVALAYIHKDDDPWTEAVATVLQEKTMPETLADRIKQAKVKKVYSVVCLETGGWLDHYNLFDGSDDHGHRQFPTARCSADNAASCQYVDDEQTACEIAEVCRRKHKEMQLTFCVVTIHLPE